MPTIIALILLTVEATINLAYYKDFIFASVVTLNFVFMWKQNFINISQGNNNTPALFNAMITLFIITAVLALGTLLFHFKSAFLRKGEYYEQSIKKIKERRDQEQDEDPVDKKDSKPKNKTLRVVKGFSTQIEEQENMEFGAGSERERGDSVGLQNYLMYRRLKGEDVTMISVRKNTATK